MTARPGPAVRTIGLLGGMSWVSTAHYYRAINAAVAARLGGDHCAPLVLWQTDFAMITELQREANWDEAGALLAAGAAALVGAGADLVGICANTMHLVAAEVAAAISPVPLVSIVDAVRDACVTRSVRWLGLLGTAYTMESAELFPAPLAKAGIEVLVPDAAGRAAIQRHTFDELVREVVTDEAISRFRRESEALIGRGADAIVLACTEHGMVLHDGEFDVPILDSAELHIAALVEAALA